MSTFEPTSPASSSPVQKACLVVMAFFYMESTYRNALITARTYRHLNPDLEVYLTVDRAFCPYTVRMDMDAAGIRALQFSSAELGLQDREFFDFRHILQDWKIALRPWLLKRLPSVPCLFLDNDTVCLRPLDLPPPFLARAREGFLLASLDLQPSWDTYLNDPAAPAYVPPVKRRHYFNSGVLLTSAAALDIFTDLREKNGRGWFDVKIAGMGTDQSALNYLLSMQYPGRVELLGTEYNSIGGFQNDISRVKIVHWCSSKYAMPWCHENLCRAILRGHQPQTYEDLFPGMVSAELHHPRSL